ncbi:MAG: hypothetical protein D4R79_13620 [Comamonadaceae bacterium]|nr:MAG: hypothetical protein D4R79_13620 [Comamonadaceae bacterium]
MSSDSEKLAGALICLDSVVNLLRSEGLKNAGQNDGLLAYQALSRIKAEAESFGVPLADIGLAGFNPDVLLKRQLQAA